MRFCVTIAFLAGLILALTAAPPARAAGQDGKARGYWAESGEASYYASRFEGRRTTSGRRYDPARMTAAHPTLPLGTKVRVTSQATGRSVVVTVNDRQPPHGVRVIDLSREAASQLGIIHSGTAMVDLALVPPGDRDATEVAQAPDDAAPRAEALSAPRAEALSAPRHGRPHRRHGGR
jgi:rare lipoprotein A